MNEGSRKAIFAAFFANLGIAASKLVGFLITGSASLLAEAVHSAADTANQLLLFFGGRQARREATPTHPFGFGRERYFWAFAVALVLFSMGGVFALYEGINKLSEPHELDGLGIAVAILLVAVVLEGYSLRTAVHEARPVKPAGMSWWRFVRTTKEPELTVVLLEDSGALTGLVFALAGVGLAHATGDSRWDAVGSMAIGVLLIVIAVVLMVKMKSLLIGEAASAPTRERIAEAITSTPAVASLIHMRTEHLGPDEVLVGAKVEFAGALDQPGLAAAIDTTEAAIRTAVPEATVIYLEPDIRREPAGPAVDESNEEDDDAR